MKAAETQRGKLIDIFAQAGMAFTTLIHKRSVAFFLPIVLYDPTSIFRPKQLPVFQEPCPYLAWTGSRACEDIVYWTAPACHCGEIDRPPWLHPMHGIN